MARINLLPWREERRQEQKTEFLAVLGGVVVIAAALILLAHQVVSGSIDDQKGRNSYLNKHIKELNQQVAEIKQLEKKRRELLDRMKVIQDLQGTRPVIVRIFDEVVRSLPDGIFYKALTRSDKKIEVTGVAESNNRISSLMRKVDASEWFATPNLTAVTANPEFGEQASSFQLSYQIGSPATDDSGKED